MKLQSAIFAILLQLCPGIVARALTEEEAKSCITQAIRDQAKLYFEVFKAVDVYDGKAKGVACRATEKAIPQAKWAELKEKIWADKRFRNLNPNGEYELDRMGFKSEKIILTGGVNAPLKRPDGYSVYTYPAHTANVVTIKDQSGEKQYVLDPMFTEDLVPVEEYKAMLNCPDKQPLAHKISAQTSEPAWKKTTTSEKDACIYSDVFLKSSRELVKVNERVESQIGSGRLYGPMQKQVLPVLGKDRATALEAHCKAVALEAED